jgi:hypothetical protein
MRQACELPDKHKRFNNVPARLRTPVERGLRPPEELANLSSRPLHPELVDVSRSSDLDPHGAQLKRLDAGRNPPLR